MDNRRFLIAALLSLVVLLAWQFLFAPPPPEDTGEPTAEFSTPPSPSTGSGVQAPEGAAGSRENAVGSAGGAAAGGVPARNQSEGNGFTEDRAEESPPAEQPPKVELPEEPQISAEVETVEKIETDRFVLELTNRGGDVKSFRLVDRPDANGEAVELVRARDEGVALPYGWVDAQGQRLPIDGVLFSVERPEPSVVRFRYVGPEGDAEKVYRFDFESDLFEVEANLKGTSLWGLLLGPGIRNPTASEFENRFQRSNHRATYGSGAGLESLVASKQEAPEVMPSSLSWVGVEDKYFLAAWFPEQGLGSATAVPVDNEADASGALLATRVLSAGDEASGDLEDLAVALVASDGVLSGRSYWGSKTYVDLQRMARAKEIPQSVPEVVRWGFFGFFAKALLIPLRWIHENVVHNYGWCIVLLTFGIKLVLLPLTHKGFVSAQRMQQLNPKMEAIRHRYKPKLKDKDGRPNFEMQRKMNEEIQALFREEGVNPLGGCLPMIVQMPILFGYYRLLGEAVELWGAPWIGWIHDLAAKDPYYVLPIVMGLSQLVTTKMMPPPSNPSQKIIMTTMPIWFTVISLGFPSGLVLYWLTNNMLTILQQGGYKRLKKAGFFGGEAPAALTTKERKRTS